MKNFLETVHLLSSRVCKCKKKGENKLGRKNLWDDVTNVFSGSVQPPTTPVQYGSYSEALKGNPYRVMMKFLEDFYSKRGQTNRKARPERKQESEWNGMEDKILD